MEHITVTIPDDHAGQRLDKGLSVLCSDLSRARLQALIKGGLVTDGRGRKVSASARLESGQSFTITIPEPEPAEPEPEDIALDIVYEDCSLLVINKPPGLVVHPGAGNWSGTLVNALLYHCKDSLSGIGGVMRPGIVHRLDKDTGGLMLVAKTNQAHKSLSSQLESRSLSRVYHALVLGVPVPAKGQVSRTISRDPYNRLKMTAGRRDGKEARTDYKVVKNFGDQIALIECKLHSGRTHQIRVHMQDKGYPLLGDPLYGPQPTALTSALKRGDFDAETTEMLKALPYQLLYAREISFEHPESGKLETMTCEPPEIFSKALNLLDK